LAQAIVPDWAQLSIKIGNSFDIFSFFDACLVRAEG